MPTKRTRRTQAPREALEPSMRRYLLTGDWDPPGAADPAPGADGDRLVQVLFRRPEYRDFWEANRDDLLETWIAQYPAGTRPWAWWRFAAPGAPRLWVVDGRAVAPDVPSEWEPGWRETWNVPLQDRLGRRPTAVESQASYLKRHGLLTRAERARLRPADFQPERVPPEDEPDERDPADDAREDELPRW